MSRTLDPNLESHYPLGPQVYRAMDIKITKLREKTDFLRNQSVPAEVRDKCAIFLHSDWRQKTPEEKDFFTIKCPAIPTKMEVRFRNEYLRFQGALIRSTVLKTISMQPDHIYYTLAKSLLFTKGTITIVLKNKIENTSFKTILIRHF